MTVGDAFNSTSIRSDDMLVGYDLPPVRQAFDLTVKSLLFLAENTGHYAYGSYLGDENGLVGQAKSGDRTAARHLRENNFPLVNWIGRGVANIIQNAQSLITFGFPPVNSFGRSIRNIEFLDEPDFDRESHEIQNLVNSSRHRTRPVPFADLIGFSGFSSRNL
jgi:hypothetical protein